MFSEYASKFLAQSQSRLSNFGGQADHVGDPSSRQSQQGDTPGFSRFSRHPSRSTYSTRAGNPYQAASRFGLASRYNSTPDAPLFHSALNEFHDEEEEDAREAADLRALQRSRRVFVASRVDESSASENDDSRASLDHRPEQESSRVYDGAARPMGIKSSWNGESSFKGYKDRQAKPTEETDHKRHHSGSSDGRMVDVGLESAVFNQVPEDLLHESLTDTSPPAFQQFKGKSHDGKGKAAHHNLERDSRLMRQAILEEDEAAEEVAPPSPPPAQYDEMFKNDQFFAWVFLIALASMLATFVLVFLHTSTPSRRLGDTIYTTLNGSFYLLAVDTVVAVVVAMVWLATLRSFALPLVVLILVGTPVILMSFSLYPMVSSFQGPDNGSRLQDTMMRWAAIIPGVGSIVFVWVVWKVRFALERAIKLLEFTSKILSLNPALVGFGFSSLAFVVGWTWIWLWMFTRVFLGGYFSASLSAFVIWGATWWLGVFFFLMYVWTLSVAMGVVRATTAGTVSNWYFHRLKQPVAPSNAVVLEAFGHATNATFGTICAATLLQIAIRLPLLILPARLARLAAFVTYRLTPTAVTVLTNPLVVTYAAIHTVPLMEAASALGRLHFLNLSLPTTTLTPGSLAGHSRHDDSLLPYRLAKLLLHATRWIMATALGMAAWVMTARQLQGTLPDGIGFRGSAYAYVVGIVASLIGWGILGALEGILAGILDAVVVCYGSERRLGTGRLNYCVEAARLFGDREEGRDMV